MGRSHKFMDPDGSSGDGSLGNPWNFDEACQECSADDVIWMRASQGPYDEAAAGGAGTYAILGDGGNTTNNTWVYIIGCTDWPDAGDQTLLKSDLDLAQNTDAVQLFPDDGITRAELQIGDWTGGLISSTGPRYNYLFKNIHFRSMDQDECVIFNFNVGPVLYHPVFVNCKFSGTVTFVNMSSTVLYPVFINCLFEMDHNDISGPFTNTFFSHILFYKCAFTETDNAQNSFIHVKAGSTPITMVDCVAYGGRQLTTVDGSYAYILGCTQRDGTVRGLYNNAARAVIADCLFDMLETTDYGLQHTNSPFCLNNNFYSTTGGGPVDNIAQGAGGSQTIPLDHTQLEVAPSYYDDGSAKLALPRSSGMLALPDGYGTRNLLGGLIMPNTDAIIAGLAGPGDYATTLTIRTTGGTAIADTQVWVNTSNDRTGSVVQADYTNANGQVTFNLDYGTYYVFCQKAGYSFATSSNTFTSASGSVTFTFDLGTQLSTGSDEYVSDSFLTRAVDLLRKTVDEPTVNKKWSDTELIGRLETSYGLVLGELNRFRTNPITSKYGVTYVASQNEYALPATRGPITKIYTQDSEAKFRTFYEGLGSFNPMTPTVWVEHNTLHLRPDLLKAGEVLYIEYQPSACARLVNGQCSVDTAGTTVTLGTTVTGTLDKRPNAYVGSLFRLLRCTSGSYDYPQERIVTAYDAENGTLTLDVALDPNPAANGTSYYEVAPPLVRNMDAVITYHAAQQLLATDGTPQRYSLVKNQYRDLLRNVRLDASQEDKVGGQRASRKHHRTGKSSRYVY